MTLTDKYLTLFTTDQVSIEIKHHVDATALCAVTIFVCSIWIRSAVFIDSLLGFMGSGEAEYDQIMAMNGALGGLVGITETVLLMNHGQRYWLWSC